jgi:LysR family glycine cleavage system transcriptional activator
MPRWLSFLTVNSWLALLFGYWHFLGRISFFEHFDGDYRCVPSANNAKELFQAMNIINDRAAMRRHRRQLPSLKALRTFEAVAHYQSFTKAADELAVSQGAVSHQIKLLESALGLQLLIRHPKGISVTVEGTRLKEVCGDAFDEIGNVALLIRRDVRAQVLKVRAGPFFAMEVIAPRVASFLKRNPGLQLHLSNMDADSASQGVEDVQIKYCVHPPAGTYSLELLKEKLVPICAPALLEDVETRVEIIRRPEIARLHYRDLGEWQSWLIRYGFGDCRANSNLFFDDQHTLLAAVRSGQGIGLADRALSEDDVERGRICVVSEEFIEPEASYKFICAQERLRTHSTLEHFRNWLVNEIAQVQEKLAPRWREGPEFLS